MTQSNDAHKPYLTTSAAAELLGVSRGTVQNWVESGQLEGWKTAGGHRRVALESVQVLIARRRQGDSGSGSSNTANRSLLSSVLVVEDDPDQLDYLVSSLGQIDPGLRIHRAENGFHGLMTIGEHRPDALITDLRLPGMDGFQLIRSIREAPSISHMLIVVVTSMEPHELEARGGIPIGVQVLFKPVSREQLRTALFPRRENESAAEKLEQATA